MGSSSENNLHRYRVEVLALSMTELASVAGVSVRTIARIEKETFPIREITYRKVYNALVSCFRSGGSEPPQFVEVFPNV